MVDTIKDLAVNNKEPRAGDVNPNHIDVITDINGSRRDNPKLEENFGDPSPDRDIEELKVKEFTPTDIIRKIERAANYHKKMQERPKRSIPGLVP